MSVSPSEHDAHDAWARILGRARTDLPETTIVMWFSDVRPTGLDGGVLTLAVPSQLVKERLQHNHLSLIEAAAAPPGNSPVKVEIVVDEAMREALEARSESLNRRLPPPPRPTRRSALLPPSASP